MTSKEAYLKIQEFINDVQLGIKRSSLDIIEPLNIIRELAKEHAILEEYNVTPEILREVLLTGQIFRNQPTFDECIKMWKDRNAKIKINHEHLLTIYIPHKDIDKYLICINFWKTSGRYDTHIYDTEDKNVYPADIDMELHDLIHKTLKALGMEK